MKQGICTNLPSQCSLAASHALIDMSALRCPECGKPLLPAPAGAGRAPSAAGGTAKTVAVGALVALTVAAGGAWLLLGERTTDHDLRPATQARSSEGVTTALRIDGSAPAAGLAGAALAEAFLRSTGAATVTRKGSGGSAGFTLIADAAPGARRDAIDVHASGADEAVRHLRAGATDLLITSRPLSATERDELRLLGDFASPATELVLALDSVAVVVAPSNPLGQISTAQLREIFAGRVANWSQLPGSGSSGPIKLYAAADNAPVLDTFRSALMAGDSLASGLTRIDNPDALLRSVATDPAAIGLVGLQHAHTAKVLPVVDGKGLALQPSRLLVATEDYPLTRRLWLYVPQHASATARRFAEFAVSETGQAVVERAGFTGQVIAPHGAADALRTAQLPPAYLQLVQGARRLSVNLRFKPGSNELDAKARRDLARIAEAMRQAPAPLLLIGFGEDIGNLREAERLAAERAAVAARALGAAGVRAAQTHGLGALAAVADSASADGRERNRRVELWIGESVAVVPRPAPVSAPAAAAALRTAPSPGASPAPTAHPPSQPAPARSPAPTEPSKPAAPAPEPSGPTFTLKPGK